jgi:hypothetical protein
LAGFAVEYTDSLLVECPSVFERIADADDAEFSEFAERAQEMEDHTLLSRPVEMQFIEDSDVYEVIGREALIAWALEVV